MSVVPSFVGTWLLQVFSILFPKILFQSFLRRKFQNKAVQKSLYGVVCGASIIISMTFPVLINKEYILDFRFIPLILAFVNGGYIAGLCLSLLIISYRLIIGGVGFYLGGLSMTFFFLVAFYYILPRSKNWNPKWKEVYPYFLLSCSIIFFALGTQLLDDDPFTANKIVFWVWFSFFSYLTLWTVMYLQNSFNEMEDISAQIIQFEKNQTIHHLLVFISQQLLSPLSSTKGRIESVRSEPLTVGQTRSLQQIETQLNQAERLVDYYQSFIDKKWGKQGNSGFVEEFEELVDLMKRYAEIFQVTLVYTSTAEDKICIKGDHSLLWFAMINIIKNAIEACEPHGRVNICLHEMLNEIFIVVEDNGNGIPPHILKRLGHPIHSSKVDGTGLGLVSAYKIAKSMGGRVKVESAPNEGTTFSLYFPKWAI